jgi:hypothetical protein
MYVPHNPQVASHADFRGVEQIPELEHLTRGLFTHGFGVVTGALKHETHKYI